MTLRPPVPRALEIRARGEAALVAGGPLGGWGRLIRLPLRSHAICACLEAEAPAP